MIINFSGIARTNFVGRAARLPLRLVPKNAVVPILQGPLRGKRWVVGSSDPGYWLGSYEVAKQRKVIELVRPGMVCWDVGAHVGFYSLLFAELVGAEGRVFAFEPLPENVEFLARHVLMNRYGNVEIMPVALADFDGAAEFDPGPNRSMGRLAGGGSLRVSCRSADSLVAGGEVQAPDLVKIDVEGAEADVLRGGATLMRGWRPVLLLATHGTQQRDDCLTLLSGLGYRVIGLSGEAPHETDELVALPG